MSDAFTVTAATLTYAGARRALDAALAAAAEIGGAFNIAVTDAAGRPLAFARMDGAFAASVRSPRTRPGRWPTSAVSPRMPSDDETSAPRSSFEGRPPKGGWVQSGLQRPPRQPTFDRPLPA